MPLMLVYDFLCWLLLLMLMVVVVLMQKLNCVLVVARRPPNGIFFLFSQSRVEFRVVVGFLSEVWKYPSINCQQLNFFFALSRTTNLNQKFQQQKNPQSQQVNLVDFWGFESIVLCRAVVGFLQGIIWFYMWTLDRDKLTQIVLNVWACLDYWSTQYFGTFCLLS